MHLCISLCDTISTGTLGITARPYKRWSWSLSISRLPLLAHLNALCLKHLDQQEKKKQILWISLTLNIVKSASCNNILYRVICKMKIWLRGSSYKANTSKYFQKFYFICFISCSVTHTVVLVYHKSPPLPSVQSSFPYCIACGQISNLQICKFVLSRSYTSARKTLSFLLFHATNYHVKLFST